MMDRRSFSKLLLLSSFVSLSRKAVSQESEQDALYHLAWPPFESLNPKVPFGYNKPTADQIKRADEIINSCPKGPRPIDVAQWFVDNFYEKEPLVISQWPKPAAWNPLIVDFFKDTSTPANSDMIAWCSAFANFCIHRSGRVGSRNASSQSFLQPIFKKTTVPEEGDLAVFTCFSPSDNSSLGLGHVTFFRAKVDDSHIHVVGGNQSKDGHSSIISETIMMTSDRAVKRHLPNGDYVPAIMRLNTYVRLA